MIELTGQKKSDAIGVMKPSFQTFIIGIYRSREEIRERLDRRTAALFENGWIQEVQQLRTAGIQRQSPAMESHGYREIAAALAADRGSISPQIRAALIADIATKGRQYAKRHDTWWRHDDRVHWITP